MDTQKITEADMKKARAIVGALFVMLARDYGAELTEQDAVEPVNSIAAAIAEERERVRAACVAHVEESARFDREYAESCKVSGQHSAVTGRLSRAILCDDLAAELKELRLNK